MLVQLSVVGLYFPPMLGIGTEYPPQMIISLPVHTAVCARRKDGALTVLGALQLFVAGLYLPSASEQHEGSDSHPHTII